MLLQHHDQIPAIAGHKVAVARVQQIAMPLNKHRIRNNELLKKALRVLIPLTVQKLVLKVLHVDDQIGVDNVLQGIQLAHGRRRGKVAGHLADVHVRGDDAHDAEHQIEIAHAPVPCPHYRCGRTVDQTEDALQQNGTEIPRPLGRAEPKAKAHIENRQE